VHRCPSCKLTLHRDADAVRNTLCLAIELARTGDDRAEHGQLRGARFGTLLATARTALAVGAAGPAVTS